MIFTISEIHSETFMQDNISELSDIKEVYLLGYNAV
jgi:hypothetical protein